MLTHKLINISVSAFLLLTVNTLLCAEDSGVEQSFLNKVKKVQNEERQAVQNLNIAAGFEENTALDVIPMYP